MRSLGGQDSRDMGMEGPLDINLLPRLTTSLDNFEIARNSTPLAVIQSPRPSIAHPRVRASSAGVDP